MFYNIPVINIMASLKVCLTLIFLQSWNVAALDANEIM